MREMLEIYFWFWRNCSTSPPAIYPCSFGKHAGPKVETLIIPYWRERSWAYITFPPVLDQLVVCWHSSKGY